MRGDQWQTISYMTLVGVHLSTPIKVCHLCSVCVCVHVIHACPSVAEESPTPVREVQVTPGRVHKRNERGETPLHIACIRGDLRLATSLIEQGADVDATDHAGKNTCTCTYRVSIVFSGLVLCCIALYFIHSF